MKFRLLSHNEDQVKVKVTSPADFLYKTVWVTRGEDHRMTIEMRDNRTFSFGWGASGFTLISEDLQKFKKAVLAFIQSKNILIELDKPTVSSAKILFNPGYNRWQLSLNGRLCYLSDTATGAKDDSIMIDEVKRFISVKSWSLKRAPNGLGYWQAEGDIKLLEFANKK